MITLKDLDIKLQKILIPKLTVEEINILFDYIDELKMKTKKNKIIKIIYPIDNGTSQKWFTPSRWDVVTKDVTYYVYNYDTIRAIEIIEEINGRIIDENLY